MTIRHVTFTATDVAISVAFFDAVLATIGLVRLQEFADEEEHPADVPLDAVGFGPPDGEPLLWVVAGPAATRGVHVAFTAGSRDQVDAFFAAGIAHGGTARQSPRRWEIYRPGYYGALVADPDANLVEAILDE
ncbi:MAG: VOC family protein [Actinomycetota bacterium]